MRPHPAFTDAQQVGLVFFWVVKKKGAVFKMLQLCWSILIQGRFICLCLAAGDWGLDTRGAWGAGPGSAGEEERIVNVLLVHNEFVEVCRVKLN